MLGMILPIFSNKKFLMFCNFPRLSHIILWQHLKKGEAVHTTWIDWLFMYIIFRLVKEHFFYIETSSLLAKSCKIKAFPLWLWPLRRFGSLSCLTCYDTGPRFTRSHPKDHLDSLPLTTTRGYWGPILTPIPMGYNICRDKH